MTYALGILGRRRQTSTDVRVPAVAPPGAQTYDELVNSFGADVVSYWKFANNGTDAKSIQNATITGSPELDVETIVDLDRLAEGAPADGVCIAWPGTVGDYAQAAHNSAHKTTAGTIVVTFQCDRLDEKSTLVAADSNGAIGGLSIEVNTNGSQRAYLRDASNTPIVLTGQAGDIAVSNAYTLVFKWGSGGLSLTLWNDNGGEIRRLTNPLTDGVSGTSTIRFGAWHTDASHHDGPYGRVVWMSRRISDIEEATLARARTITRIIQPPAQQDALVAPSLTEWLTSDVANPGTITKYVSNANRGNGSGSSAANAQEVQAALNGASAGQTFLAVCQSAGSIEYWNYPNGLTFPSGNSSNRITLQARQGDGVVIHQGGAYIGARTPNSGFWTQSGLSQDDIDKKIWRSSSTFSGGAQTMMGTWFEFDIPHQLLSAGNMTNLRATYGTGDSPGNYATPMVHQDTDNRVYIRFQRPHPGKYSAGNKWSAETYPGHPEAIVSGQNRIPLSENPNSYTIHLWENVSIGPFRSGQWLKIGAGINSCGFRFAIDQSNTIMDRGLHITWRHINRTGASGDVRQNIFCNRTRFTDCSKIHANRAEWKFGGWLEGGFRSDAISGQNSNNLKDLYFKDCTIGHYHELCAYGYSGLTGMRFRNCTFYSILDDGFQMAMGNSNVEVGYCYYYNSAYGGFGIAGDATQEPGDPDPGGWFFHHNIVDCRQERGTDWTAQPHPHFVYISHSPNGSRPQKTYNNLIIWGPDTENKHGPGLEHSSQSSGGNNTLTGTRLMHEVFNNIILRVHLEGTKRYTPWTGDANTSYSDSGFHAGTGNYQSDFVLGYLTRYGPDESNELFDYNCYWRPSSMTTDPLFLGHTRGGALAKSNYSTLAAWKGSSEFTYSKTGGTRRGAYSPGFDGNSTESKPSIPTIDNYPVDRFKYRPSATTAVTTATSGSLGGSNWWSTPPTWGTTYFGWTIDGYGLAPSPWKGPLDPNGSTLPIGVQNP